MKELKINISKDFSKYIGGRERKISEFSGEDFRERYLKIGGKSPQTDTTFKQAYGLETLLTKNDD